MAEIAIIGAGLMGTAMAWPLSDNGHQVRLVGTHLDGEIIRSLKERGWHPRLKRQIPPRVTPCFVEELAGALAGAEIVVSGVSSPGVHWAGRTIGPHLTPGQMVIAVTKGLEAAANGDLRILPDVLADEFPPAIRERVPVAAIGGPCIAGELAGRRQSCVLFGCRDGRGRRAAGGDIPHPLLSYLADDRPGRAGDQRCAEKCLRAGGGAGGRDAGACRRR